MMKKFGTLVDHGTLQWFYLLNLLFIDQAVKMKKKK